MRRFAVTSVVFAVFLLAVPTAFAQVGGDAPASAEEESAEQRSAGTAPETSPEASDEGEPAQGESPVAEEEGGQDAATGSMAESKASQERTIPGGTLAVISYILLWLMTMAFIGLTARRQSQLAGELEELEQRMDRVVGDFDDGV